MSHNYNQQQHHHHSSGFAPAETSASASVPPLLPSSAPFALPDDRTYDIVAAANMHTHAYASPRGAVSKSARVSGAAPTQPPIVGSSKLRGAYINDHIAEAVARPKPAIPWATLSNPQLSFLTDGVVERHVEETFSNIFSETPAYKTVLETPLYKPPLVAPPRHAPASAAAAARLPAAVSSAAAASAVTGAALAGSAARAPSSMAISTAPYRGYTGPDRAGGGGLARLNKGRIGPNALSRAPGLGSASADSASSTAQMPPTLALTCALEHSLALSPLQRGLTARIRDASGLNSAALAASSSSAGAAAAASAAAVAQGPITSRSMRIHSAAAAQSLAAVAAYAAAPPSASGSNSRSAAAAATAAAALEGMPPPAAVAAAASAAAASRARVALGLTMPPPPTPAAAAHSRAAAARSRSSSPVRSLAGTAAGTAFAPYNHFPSAATTAAAANGARGAVSTGGGDPSATLRPFATAAEVARARAPAPPPFGPEARAAEDAAAAAYAAQRAATASSSMSARLTASAPPLALALARSGPGHNAHNSLGDSSARSDPDWSRHDGSGNFRETRLTVPQLQLPTAPAARALTSRSLSTRALRTQPGSLSGRASDVKRVDELHRRQLLPVLGVCLRLPPPPVLHAPQRLEDPSWDPSAALPASLRALTARRAAGLAAAGSTREIAAERLRALTQEQRDAIHTVETARAAAASEAAIEREIAALNSAAVARATNAAAAAASAGSAADGASSAGEGSPRDAAHQAQPPSAGSVVVSAVRARAAAPAVALTAPNSRYRAPASAVAAVAAARHGAGDLDGDARDAQTLADAQASFPGPRALTARPRADAAATRAAEALIAQTVPRDGAGAERARAGTDAAALASKGARRSAELFEGHRAALLRLVRDYELRAQACARAGQTRAEANAYYCIGVLHDNLRCPREAAEWYSKFVVAAHAAGDNALMALGHNALGIALAAAAAAEAGSDDAMVSAVEDAVAQHEAHLAVADLYGIFVANTNIGVLSGRLGHFAAAAAAHKRALEAAAQLQAPIPLITATGNLGLAAFADGAFDAAATCLEQFLELGEQFPALVLAPARATALLALGEMAVAQHEYGYARHLLQNALDEAARAGDWAAVSKCRVALGVVSGAAAAETGLKALGAAMAHNA